MLQKFPADLRILTAVATLLGASDSLAAINTSLLPNNAIAMVEASNTLYVLRKTSTAIEDVPNVIQPDQGGDGRWYRYGQGDGYFADLEIGHAAIPPQTGIDSNSVAVPGVASDNDVITTNLVSSGMNAGIAFGPPRITGAAAAVWRLANVTAATIAAGTISVRVSVSTST